MVRRDGPWGFRGDGGPADPCCRRTAPRLTRRRAWRGGILRRPIGWRADARVVGTGRRSNSRKQRQGDEGWNDDVHDHSPLANVVACHMSPCYGLLRRRCHTSVTARDGLNVQFRLTRPRSMREAVSVTVGLHPAAKIGLATGLESPSSGNTWGMRRRSAGRLRPVPRKAQVGPHGAAGATANDGGDQWGA